MNDHFESFRRCIEALNESGTLEMNMQTCPDDSRQILIP